MRLICCGSGSTGNTYLLTNGEETLVLDCGVPFMQTKVALDFNVRGIQGAVVTHSHGDHCKFSHEYEDAGITVWKPYENANLRQEAFFGGFRVHSFSVVHNVPCCGFLIGHKGLGKLLYVTDAEYVRYRFKNLSAMLIEANYSSQSVSMTDAKTRHILTGHMSLETCMEAIKANASPALNHIVLCHLSGTNGDPEGFRDAVKGIAPAGCTVDVAERGVTVDLADMPF